MTPEIVTSWIGVAFTLVCLLLATIGAAMLSAYWITLYVRELARPHRTRCETCRRTMGLRP
jgi:hypothetical protein